MKKSTYKYRESTVYNIHFYGVTDLYNYLTNISETTSERQKFSLFKSKGKVELSEQQILRKKLLADTRVNTELFKRRNSLFLEEDFAGQPLEVAVGYLLGGYRKDFHNFLKYKRKLQNTITTNIVDSYETKQSIYGGIPYPPLVAAGIPNCMLIQEPRDNLLVRNVYVNLAYGVSATPEQIRNRGLATLYIMEALKKNGIIVNFNAFDLSINNREKMEEIHYMTINLKGLNEYDLNLEKCYFLLTSKEIARRILARILELSDITCKDWERGYGEPLNLAECHEFLGTTSDDIVIAKPSEHGITGKDIYEDTLNMIESLNIQNEFNLKELKKLSKTPR